MRFVSTAFAVLVANMMFSAIPVQAEDSAPSRLDSITKSAREAKNHKCG